MANNSSPGTQMGRNAFSTVGSASFGMITSVLLDAIVIARFGMGKQTDAFFIANTIPTTIITILMLQATRVIQPIFIAKRQKEGEAEAWRYLNLVMTSGTVIVAAFCAGLILLSPVLMGMQAFGSGADEIKMTISLGVMLFAILPLYFSIVVLRAALNSLGVFALPGAMKLFENVFKIFFVLVLARRIGIETLVLGTLASVLWQILVFYLVLRRKGFRFQFVLGFRHPDMVQAYRLVGFQLTGQLCGVGVDIVNNTMGSMLGAGNVTALRLATRIIDSFGGLLPASVVFAAMPAVATSVANRDMPATKKHLQRAIYLLLLVSLPLSVWLAVVHRPLIAFLYQRASFSVNDTIMVSNLLLLMIPYLFLGRFHGLMELPFFADQDTRTPLMASVVAAMAYVAGSLLLISHLGIFALPVGRITSSISGPCFLGYLLRRRIGSLGLRAIRTSAWKVCEASFVMVAFTFLGSLVAPAIPVPGLATKIFALGFPTAVGFVAMIISFFALGIMDSTILDVYLPNRRQWLTRLGVTAE